MIWLYLLLAIAAFVFAFYSPSVALAVVSLLAALGFVIAWIMGLLAQRIGSQSRDDSMILDPQELRRLREQAAARRAAAASTTVGEPPSTG
ncbi:MAG: hypothetical protein ACREO8_09830 [Luteimonas sp.]